ncbi:MAG: 1-acyl-sn-glycerol-3-phosphate acyltransferase [Gammaproteobacteria bacterium]|jgi:1-acyl-sn-glycerol-3-phosphate acyltransferase|nr:1-acyl-sn-glycerol-3-phosphate acyltransferase [Gammaproteobacteria bacterium]
MIFLRRCLHFLWGIYALLVFSLLALAVVVAVALIPSHRICRGIVHRVSRLILWLAGIPLEVRHLDRLPKGPCVIVANHASYLDGPLIAAALPPIFSFVIKQEIRKIPGAHLLLRRVGSHFVERSDRKRSAADARRILNSAKDGQALAFFAEGTFQRDPGLMRFRMGAFSTAVRADFPVVPMVIRGARHILPSGSWLPRPGKLEVIIQLPLKANQLAANPTLELLAATRAEMLRELGEPDLAPETTARL